VISLFLYRSSQLAGTGLAEHRDGPCTSNDSETDALQPSATAGSFRQIRGLAIDRDAEHCVVVDFASVRILQNFNATNSPSDRPTISPSPSPPSDHSTVSTSSLALHSRSSTSREANAAARSGSQQLQLSLPRICKNRDGGGGRKRRRLATIVGEQTELAPSAPFECPTGVAAMPDGRFLVTDYRRNNVQVVDSNGWSHMRALLRFPVIFFVYLVASLCCLLHLR
jgi:DNA-binding beta-propeller fold protein YncE